MMHRMLALRRASSAAINNHAGRTHLQITARHIATQTILQSQTAAATLVSPATPTSPLSTPSPSTSSSSSSKKGAQPPRQAKLVAPLLTRLLKSRTNISADDWANVVTLNRKRILQLKEREQFRAWRSFQRMKTAKIAWLAARNEKVSDSMQQRIKDREDKILQISQAARDAMNAPIPPVPSRKRRVKTSRALRQSAKALAQPQTFLQTALPTEPWRVFTFRLSHYHSHILHKQMEKFREIAKKLGLTASNPVYLPHKVKKFSIIRSPHVDKTSREQYETRIYTCLIRFSPSVEKLYAIQRLSEIAFRLINGNVTMRVETPPNVAVESITFAPNPTKAEMGHTPAQQYAVRDSPGIENILYKFDQHQFPFLADWEEEILDEKFRGIYPEGRDVNFPLPVRADLMLDGGAALEGAEGELDAAADQDVGEVFDEQAESASVEDAMEDELEVFEDEEEIDINDDRSVPERDEDTYNEHVRPLVPRKKRHE